MTKDEVLNLRVPADVKAALKRAALADDRSVSAMALRIIREYLGQAGQLGHLDFVPRQRRERKPRQASKKPIPHR